MAMNLYEDQIRATMNQFEAAVTTMAWGIAAEVIEQQRGRLAAGLTDIAIKAEKRSLASSKAGATRILRMAVLLDSKVGTWTRGGGIYKVIGPGKEPETYDLVNNSTGQKITATLKTLAFRWKHTP
jgi:hypothetical protein